MGGLNRTQTGKTAHEWQSLAGAFFQWAPMVITATATGVSHIIIDGNDAWALGFLLVPGSGTCTVAIERSLDGGQNWIVVTALALTGTVPVEKIEAAPLGLYRINVSAVPTTLDVRVLKKVALAR